MYFLFTVSLSTLVNSDKTAEHNKLIIKRIVPKKLKTDQVTND